MKDKIKALREKLKKKYMKAIIFFIFYFLFFLFIVVISKSDNDIEEKENIDDVEYNDKWLDLNNNYEFYYDINIFDNENIVLQGKRYQNKNLFTKYINGEKDNIIYTFYDNIYLNQNGIWEENNNFELIKKDFNYNLIDINYIKQIVNDAIFIEEINNFDETVEEKYLYSKEGINDINIVVVSLNEKITKIKLETINLYLVLQFKNINEVENFVINH
jgi:hypothetical protein